MILLHTFLETFESRILRNVKRNECKYITKYNVQVAEMKKKRKEKKEGKVYLAAAPFASLMVLPISGSTEIHMRLIIDLFPH